MRFSILKELYNHLEIIKYNIFKGDMKMKKLMVILIINLMYGCGFISQMGMMQQPQVSQEKYAEYNTALQKLVAKLPDKTDIDSPVNAAYKNEIANVKMLKCEAYYGQYKNMSDDTVGKRQYDGCIERISYSVADNINNIKEQFASIDGVDKNKVDKAAEMYNRLKYAASLSEVGGYASWLTSNDSFYSAALINSVSVPLYASMLSTIWNNDILQSSDFILSNKKAAAVHLLYEMYRSNYDINNSVLQADILIYVIFLEINSKTITDDKIELILSKHTGFGWKPGTNSKDTSAQLYIIENKDLYSIEYTNDLAKNRTLYKIFSDILDN